MLVFFEKKMVIFAATKTGSTALHGALSPRASMTFRNPPAVKHASVQKYQRILKPTFEELGAPKDMETFALIRHPVEWLSSWFRYRCRDALIGKPNSTRDVSFNDFVLEYMKEQPRSFADVGSQSSFLTGIDSEIAIDHLYQYEAEDPYLKFLSDRLDMTIETKRRNVSPDFEVTLDPSIRKDLEALYRVDFDLWHIAQH